MKIALFTETYLPFINGVVTHVHMLKQTFEEMGHEVLVVTVGAEKQDEIIYEDGVIYVPGIYLKKIYGYRVATPIDFKRKELVLDFEPDIIHIHNEFGIAETGIRAAKKLNVPLIYTLHTEYDEFLFYVSLYGLKNITQSLSLKYFKHFSDAADVILSPSPKAKNYIKKQGVDKEVIVIDNTVDVEKYKKTEEKEAFRKEFREKYKLTDQTKAFVFVGRIGDEKNIMELIDNFTACDFPREKAVLFIIGKGPQEEELKEKIKNNNMEDRIILFGALPNTEIAKHLYAMDYYTTGSVSEMHSISMLEAMATGLPALIKLDPPNKDQIKPGINGYQWKDQDEFKEIFNQVLNYSPEEHRKFKEAVLKYSAENDRFSQAEKLIDIYQKAIDDKKNNTNK